LGPHPADDSPSVPGIYGGVGQEFWTLDDPEAARIY
jgi:hypothetical protein